MVGAANIREKTTMPSYKHCYNMATQHGTEKSYPQRPWELSANRDSNTEICSVLAWGV